MLNKVQCSLTVFFEKSFWVGIFEKIENDRISVSKITFGSEPKDYQIYELILKHYDDLKYSPTIETIIKETKKTKTNATRYKEAIERN